MISLFGLSFLLFILRLSSDSKLLEIYFKEYYGLLNAKKRNMVPKYDLANLTIDLYDYSEWYKQQLGNLPPLESDEDEVKEGKGIKCLILNKLLTRFPILLAQIKAGNNLYKLKNKIRKIAYLFCQHNEIAKKICNNLIKSP